MFLGSLLLGLVTIIGVGFQVAEFFNMGPSIELKPMETKLQPQNIQDNVVTANGIGIIDMNINNVSQRMFLAKRAALADAKRNLAEVIYGSFITGVTNVENGKTSKDTVQIKVHSILKLATIVSERELNDGTIQVTMKTSLNQ